MAEQAGEHVDALTAEHGEDFGPAMRWLVGHPSEARAALRQLLGEDRADMATSRALEVLGRIGDAADVTVIADRLEAGRGTFAGDAAHALALHPAGAAREALASAARSDVTDVARAAVTGLEERRDPETRSVLEELIDHGDRSVRYRAIRALRALGPAPSRAALERRRAVETDGEVRALIDEVLA
jgi:HEAT repeat protein